MPRILIVAGDPSGDHQAARLARELLGRRPDMQLYGYGGPEMAAAGVRVDADLASLSAIGLLAVLGVLPKALTLLRRLSAEVRREPPDLAILVDCGAFNLRLAPVLKALGVPVLGFFPPGSWSGSRKRAAGVASSYSAVATPFPQALPAYEQLGFPATLVGHPLVDELAPVLEQRRSLALDPPVLALLPGSRRPEIRHILPPMLAAAARLQAERPGLRVIVSRAPSVPTALFEQIVRQSGVAVETVSGSLEALGPATAALVKSGTVALEATLLQVPFVCLYRVGLPAWAVAKVYYWPRPVYWAMPNILLNRMVVPQRFQFEVTGARLADAVGPLLDDTAERTDMIRGLAEASAKLGGGGATERTAELVLGMLADSPAGPASPA